MLNTEEAQEIKNINHHISLFNFSLGEIIFSDNKFEAPEESGTTFFENALIKAKYYSKKFLLPVISEDSGLCVKALDYKPGIFSSNSTKSNLLFSRTVIPSLPFEHG